MEYYTLIDSFIGRLAVRDNGSAVTAVYFESEIPDGAENSAVSPISQLIKSQFGEYFAGTLKNFTLPLVPFADNFSGKVYRQMMHIPYGGLISYSELAALSGSPAAARAVGNANNKNPLPVIVPCHRVVGKSGGLTGFRPGVDIKKKLIEFEAAHK